MKTRKFISLLLLTYFVVTVLYSQENVVVPQRIPEQEAQKQTEKMQQELELSPEQAKRIYEINLKYARARQISNTRSAALERMKNKNAEIEQVLNEEQNYRLQTKRYEHTPYENPAYNRNQISPSSSGFRQEDYRSNPGTRTPAQNEPNTRNSYRTVPDYQNGMQTQTTRRSAAPTQGTQQYQNNRQATRQAEPLPAPGRRSEPTGTPQYNTTPSRSGSSNSTYSPSRQDQPASRSGRR